MTKSDTVAVLGLAYKPDTYITEESAGLYLAQQLKRHGYRVVVHDYGAKPDNAPSLHEFDHLDDPGVLAAARRRQAGGDLLSVAAVSLGEVRPRHQGPDALEALSRRGTRAGRSSAVKFPSLRGGARLRALSST